MSVSSEINNSATYTAQYQASQTNATGAASKVTSTDFLNLMMKQLQYQDPLSPVDNSQFLAQQAQFSQLEATNEMNKTLASSTGINQALSLVGKYVALTDPDNSKNVIVGQVTSATVNGENSSIVVGGKEYALKYVQAVTDKVPDSLKSTDDSTSTGDSSSTTDSSTTSAT